MMLGTGNIEEKLDKVIEGLDKLIAVVTDTCNVLREIRKDNKEHHEEYRKARSKQRDARRK